MLLKIKSVINDILVVSKITNTSKKKLKISLSILLANISVLIDIVIILFFADYFQDTSNLFLIDYLKDNLYLLPFLIVLRFTTLYFEKFIILALQLEIEKNLKIYLMSEVFYKGNYSTADAFFYVGQLSNHVAYFYKSLATLINISLQALVYLGYIIIFQSQSLTPILVISIILFFPSKKLSTTLRKYVDKAYHQSKEVFEKIERLIENLYLIKILNKQEEELKDFKATAEYYKKYKTKDFQLGTINALIPPFITLFIISVIFNFYQGIKFFSLELIGILLRLFQSFGEINRTIGMVINSQVHLEKLYLVEKNKKSVNKNNYKIEELEDEVAVNFKNVSFKYIGAEELIFENLSFKINKNQHTIITGENGSGKSTILGLIAGVYFPTDGNVITHSDKYGYVGPNPLIIKGTLKDNLIYGLKKEYDHKVLEEFVYEFQLFKESKENILETKISNKDLSSGQMQKISLIRALILEPEILILDEAFSNLDTISRKLISEKINKKEITIINSTHSTIDLDYDNHFSIEISQGQRKIVER